jgi:ABC-type antimicrobial peptide transport system permease subunit
LSYDVSQRRREIGVRAALGASRLNLLSLVLRQGLGVTAAGIAVGLGVAAWLAPLLRRLLFGIQALDATSFVVAPLVLLVVATAACLLPARRAAAIAPADALRE